MSLMGHYVLVATCDDARHMMPPVEFVGTSAEDCLSQAGRAGWAWDLESNVVYCSGHQNEGQLDGRRQGKS